MAETSSLRRPFPRYAVIPLALLICLHFTVYNGTKLINVLIPAVNVSLPIDAAIPLVPEWVFIYELTGLFWAAGMIMVGSQKEILCYKLLGCTVVAELICAVFFLFMPSYVVIPELEVDSLASWMLAFTYQMDVPTNCFPSMHCLLAYIVFRQSFYCDNVKPWMKALAGVITVLVCLSTVFVKQHVVLDIIGGLFCGELAMQWGMRSNVWKVFYKVNKKLMPKIWKDNELVFAEEK